MPAIDAYLWAERFDRDTSNLFAVQDEISSRSAIALNIELIGAEAARPTEHLDALDYIFRGRAARRKPNSRKVLAEAVSMFERALALDPQSVEAQIRLANSLVGRVLDQMTDSAAADLARAEGLIAQALVVSPRNALAHEVNGQVLRAQYRYREAVHEYETALALNRNSVWSFFHLGWCKLYAGSIDEVIPLVEQAIRLSPRDPQIATMYARIGFVHLLQSRTDEAMPWLEKARSANPELPLVHAYLASAQGLKGGTERAAAELAEARRLAGEGSYSSIAHLKAAQYFRVPKVRALFEATYFAGLRKAGMPEE